ncbi:MAG: TolC family protein [Candidatus Thiodiazotropha sp.]|jgi:outer membrane protein TolC
MYPFKQALLATSITALISGCTVAPIAMDKNNIITTAQADATLLAKQQDRIDGPIGLDEAIARALKNNRDKKLKALETALAQGQVDLVQHEMLPSLTTSAGYTSRNNYAATASVTFSDDEPDSLGDNPNYSVSQDKERTTYDAVFSWNLLDFGLSYVRANQHADRYLIAKERERKVVHNITQEVRAAYWRAVSAERLLKQIGLLSEKANTALANSREVETKRLRSPIEALYYQRELLDIQRSLQSLRQDLVNAKIELAGLMGLKPGTVFKLGDVSNPDFKEPTLDLDLASMEKKALTNRPELVETYYQKRISAAETRAAILKIFPGINLNAGIYHDSNDYLRDQNWNALGAQISWNLFDVFKVPAEQRLAKTRKALADEQRLATSMAVLTQVHLAKVRFEQARNSYKLADQYLDVASRIYQQSKDATQNKRSSELDLIRESLNTVLAELRRDVAYADLQNSYGKVFVTMGMDLVPENYTQTSLKDLSSKISERFARWQRGEIEENRATPPSRTDESLEKEGA